MPLPQVGLEAAIQGLKQFEAGATTILNAYDGIEKKAGGVTKATGGLGSALSSLGSPLSALGGQFVGLGESLLKVGAIAGGAALAGVVALGGGIAALTVSGISQAKDLDQQMANIAATMGLAKDAVGPLKQEILDLSLDPNLTVNTTQAAQAIELLAQNGLTMSQVLDGAAKSTVAMANATGADFGTAANIATGAMQAFNLEASDLSTVADGITGVLVTSKFKAEDYALALANAGEIAHSSGVSLDDFNTIIASTASSFSSGSDAGTSLKTLLQRFANPTDETKKAMSDLGISVFDSAGNMRDMKDIVGDLNRAFKGMTDKQRAQTAAVIGGTDASRTLLALSGMTSDEFETLSGQVNKSGQAFTSAATRVDTLSGAWEILQGIIQAIQIQVGDLFLPILQQMTGNLAELSTTIGPAVVAFFTGLIAKGQELFSSFQKFGAGGLLASLGLEGGALLFKKVSELMTLVMGDSTTLADTLTNTLGAAISFLSTNLLPALTVGVQFVIDHFEEIKGALLGVGAVLAGGIFAAIVAGIASLVSPIMLVVAGAALLGAAWAGNWGGIQEKTMAVWMTIQPAFIQIGNWLGVVLPAAGLVLANLWTNILGPAISTSIDFLIGTAIPAWFSLWNVISTNVFAAISGLAAMWTNTLLPAITAVSSFITTNITPLFMSINDLIGAVAVKAGGALAALWENVLLPALRAVSDFITANITPSFIAINAIITDRISPTLKGFSTKELPAVTKAFEWVIKAIKDATGWFQSLAKAVRDFTLPDFLVRHSPSPLEQTLMGVADNAQLAATALSQMAHATTGGISQASIDSLLKLNRHMADTPNVINAANQAVEHFLNHTKGLGHDKVGPLDDALTRIFTKNKDKILGAGDKKAQSKMFADLLSGGGEGSLNLEKLGFGGTRSGIVTGAISLFIDSFKDATVRLKDAQQRAFIQAGRTAVSIGNSLNDIITGSANVLDTRVQTLQALVDSGLSQVNFEGTIISSTEAQQKLNQALLEQKSIQDDLLQTQQNQAKLDFLNKQLDLLDTIKKAGLDPTQILGGLQLGLDASIPDIIAATNRLVQAMVDQVNADLQIASPSKVMAKAGLFTGKGFGLGMLASIPDVMKATQRMISSVPAMIQAPALGGGSGAGSVRNTNFNMTVNTGATPQSVIGQYAIMQAMVG